MDKNVAERWLTRIEEEVGENGLDSDPHVRPYSNQGIGGGGEKRSRQTRDAEAAEARNLPALPRSGGVLEPTRVYIYMPCSDCGQGQLATAQGARCGQFPAFPDGHDEAMEAAMEAEGVGMPSRVRAGNSFTGSRRDDDDGSGRESSAVSRLPVSQYSSRSRPVLIRRQMVAAAHQKDDVPCLGSARRGESKGGRGPPRGKRETRAVQQAVILQERVCWGRQQNCDLSM